METKRKTTKLTKILIIIIILLVGYIAYAKYSEMRQADLQEAANVGYQQAIVDIAQNAATCQQVPLIIGNQSINLVAVECLQAPAQTEEITE